MYDETSPEYRKKKREEKRGCRLIVDTSLLANEAM
jgi:hypothetical protein